MEPAGGNWSCGGERSLVADLAGVEVATCREGAAGADAVCLAGAGVAARCAVRLAGGGGAVTGTGTGASRPLRTPSRDQTHSRARESTRSRITSLPSTTPASSRVWQLVEIGFRPTWFAVIVTSS